VLNPKKPKKVLAVGRVVFRYNYLGIGGKLIDKTYVLNIARQKEPLEYFGGFIK